MEMILGRGARYTGLIFRNATYVPKISVGTLRCLCQCDIKRQSIIGTNLQWSLASKANTFGPQINNSRTLLPNSFLCNKTNVYSTESKKPAEESQEPPVLEKKSIFQRMKQMTKDYWYILIPVHLVTSIGWMTLFYVTAKNGVDIIGILKSLNLSERYLDILRGSSAGHWAVAYALYKLATPVRYTVTVGGTTMTIRYLNRWGYLKFTPRSTMKEMQSTVCEEQREKLAKTTFKDHQQTEPPKT